MIDRKMLLQAAQTERGPKLDEIGAGKPWQKPWSVLMGVATCTSADEFNELLPRLNRNLDDFQYWLNKLRQDPRKRPGKPEMDVLFRDPELGKAVKMLFAVCSPGLLIPGRDDPLDGQREARLAIYALLRRTAHVPR